MKLPHEHSNGASSSSKSRGKSSLNGSPTPVLSRELVSRLALEVARELSQGGTPARPRKAAKPVHAAGRRNGRVTRSRLTDTTPPVNDGGKVALNVASKVDTDLVNFTYAHISDMTDNDYYQSPQPSADDFQVLADDFANAVTAKLNAANALKNAMAVRDAARLALIQSFTAARGPYVQMASNGNTQAILSSGLSVRASNTPAGVLSPPQGFRVDLNGTPGAMFFSCSPVTSARGYIIQFADASTGDRNWLPFATMTTTRYNATGMGIGKTFAFRIAAVGGSDGQSDWSPEIIRTAA